MVHILELSPQQLNPGATPIYFQSNRITNTEYDLNRKGIEMTENQTVDVIPGKVRSWRIGFLVLSSVMVAISISVAVLLEVSRQITFEFHWSYVGPYWFAAEFLLICQGFLSGAWLSIQVVFGSTHPKYKHHHWRWVFIGFLVIGFFTVNVFYFAQLLSYSYRIFVSPSWLIQLNWELIFNSILNLIMAFTFGALSTVFWLKWLKPLTKE